MQVSNYQSPANTLKKIGGLFCVGLFLLCFIQGARAEKSKDETKTKTVIKEVQGEVSALTSHFIAIVYKKDKEKGIEYEMALPIGEDVRVVYKRRLEEIEVGDIVKVQYEEVQEEYEEIGKGGVKLRKTKVISRQVKRIIFLKPKLKGLRSEAKLSPSRLQGWV